MAEQRLSRPISFVCISQKLRAYPVLSNDVSGTFQLSCGYDSSHLDLCHENGYVSKYVLSVVIRNLFKLLKICRVLHIPFWENVHFIFQVSLWRWNARVMIVTFLIGMLGVYSYLLEKNFRTLQNPPPQSNQFCKDLEGMQMKHQIGVLFCFYKCSVVINNARPE